MQLLERDVSRRTPTARVMLQALRGIDPGAAGEGARSLAGAVATTLLTTAPSAPDLNRVSPARVSSSEAETLPGGR
jgi:hypothetical protein